MTRRAESLALKRAAIRAHSRVSARIENVEIIDEGPTDQAPQEYPGTRERRQAGFRSSSTAAMSTGV